MVKIVSGKLGFVLCVDGLYIHLWTYPTGEVEIKAVQGKNGIPYGASEFVNVQAVRGFWNEYRPMIVAATKLPYKSEFGKLIRARY